MEPVNIKPFTKGAYNRAAQSDKNKNRCLIENCSSNRAVKPTNAFSRENTRYEKLMAAIEWHTKLQKFTLNLDTRRNIFMVGASLLALYQQKRWGLVPEESVIDRYFNEAGTEVRPRNEFPEFTVSSSHLFTNPLTHPSIPKDLESITFTFIPLQQMEEVYITHQTDLPDGKRKIDVFFFPYSNFPKVSAAFDPKFAILQIGSILKSMDDEKQTALLTTYPLLAKIRTLFNAWTGPVPQDAENDETYVLPVPEEERYQEDDLFSETSSVGESICTPTRRIWVRPLPETDDEAMDCEEPTTPIRAPKLDKGKGKAVDPPTPTSDDELPVLKADKGKGKAVDKPAPAPAKVAAKTTAPKRAPSAKANAEAGPSKPATAKRAASTKATVEAGPSKPTTTKAKAAAPKEKAAAPKAKAAAPKKAATTKAKAVEETPAPAAQVEGLADAGKRVQPGRGAKKRVAEDEMEDAPVKKKAVRGKAAAKEVENAPPVPVVAPKRATRPRKK
ncbi:hypothetical protein CVT24_002300 [Panaeolus cyanescens]|uniref:Uncharacterized protein n=1 Tax=Panaeolus cyanescens TaxID=181874 RepID=A0A409YIR8_9AGAR|nr:hypothetical protein CVT24_002300 [Panaeolus cyanescens]